MKQPLATRITIAIGNAVVFCCNIVGFVVALTLLMVAYPVLYLLIGIMKIVDWGKRKILSSNTGQVEN